MQPPEFPKIRTKNRHRLKFDSFSFSLQPRFPLNITSKHEPVYHNTASDSNFRILFVTKYTLFFQFSTFHSNFYCPSVPAIFYRLRPTFSMHKKSAPAALINKKRKGLPGKHARQPTYFSLFQYRARICSRSVSSSSTPST